MQSAEDERISGYPVPQDTKVTMLPRRFQINSLAFKRSAPIHEEHENGHSSGHSTFEVKKKLRKLIILILCGILFVQ